MFSPLKHGGVTAQPPFRRASVRCAAALPRIHTVIYFMLRLIKRIERAGSHRADIRQPPAIVVELEVGDRVTSAA
jgi:hypothetical protein